MRFFRRRRTGAPPPAAPAAGPRPRPDVAALLEHNDMLGVIEALGYRDDEDIRASAARALGRFSSSVEPIAPLVGALNDASERVSSAAVEALEELFDRYSNHMRLFHASDEKRQALLAALDPLTDEHSVALRKKLHGKVVLEQIERRLTSESRFGWRTELGWLTGAYEYDHLDQPAMQELLEPFADAGAMAYLFNVIHQGSNIAETPHDYILDYARGRYANRSERRSINATTGALALAKYLQERASPQTIALLRAVLASETETLARRIVAAEALVLMEYPQALDLAITAWRGHLLSTWALLDVLRIEDAARLLEPSLPQVESAFVVILDEIAQRLSSDDTNEQEWITAYMPMARLLHGHASSATVERMIAALDHPQVKVRAVAAQVLGKMGDERAVEPLMATLQRSLAQDQRNDVSQWRLRIELVRALGRLGDRRAVDVLIAALQAGEVIVDTAAVEALGDLGDPRAIEPLMEARTRKLQDAETLHRAEGDLPEAVTKALAHIQASQPDGEPG